MTDILWRITKYVLGLAALVIAALVGRMFSSCETTTMPLWPNWPGCQLNAVARYPSDDGADLATVLKRDCYMGEEINYFLRLDVHGRQPGRNGWYTIEELENDKYPVSDPAVVWTKKTAIQVTVSTRTLSGTLVEHAGDDIEIIRVYHPRDPGAFPNY